MVNILVSQDLNVKRTFQDKEATVKRICLRVHFRRRVIAQLSGNDRSKDSERGTRNKVHDNGDNDGDGKAEEVSERWNDPADRIVSAYVSLAEGNICVMACESYVTQERTSTLFLFLSSLSLSLFLFLSCPFLDTCALFSASLCLPSSRKGYGGHRSPVATGGTSSEPQEENIFFLYPQPLGPRVGHFGFEVNAETRWKFSESRGECQRAIFNVIRKRIFLYISEIKI